MEVGLTSIGNLYTNATPWRAAGSNMRVSSIGDRWRTGSNPPNVLASVLDSVITP
jgi:hypothetical protein